MGSEIVQPRITAQLLNATLPIANAEQRILLVGQMTAAGEANDGQLYTASEIGNSGREDDLFGPSSMLAEMVRATKRVSTSLRVDALPLDDASGTNAAVTTLITSVGGTALFPDTWTVFCGSEQNNSYDIAISVGDTPTEVAAAIVAAVSADTTSPFTAGNAAGTITFTSVHDGTVGNTVPIGVRRGAYGWDEIDMYAATMTLSVPGATDPTLTGILDVIDNIRYQAIVWPYPTDDEAEDELETRWDTTNNVLDGVLITHDTLTYADHLTALGSLNSKCVVYIADKLELTVPPYTAEDLAYRGPTMMEPGYVISSYVAAIRAMRLTDGEVIGRFLTTQSSLDQYGGAALASLPYFNTVMAEMPVNQDRTGWTQTEIEALYDAGACVIGSNTARDAVLMGEMVTTYLTDAASDADPTWHHLNAVDTASGIREYMVNNAKSHWAQSRLTEGTIARGRDQVNAASIQQYFEQMYSVLSGPSYVLTQSGETALQYFRDHMTITIDMVTGSATVAMVVPIVVQLRAVDMTIRIAFSTTGG